LPYIEPVIPPSRLRGPLATLGRIQRLVWVGFIAGLLVAAAAYPLAAIGGLTLKAGSDFYQSLPTVLRLTAPAQTTYVYAADGTTLLTMFYDEHRKYTSVDAMSDTIRQAIVASEDARFYEHRGVDIKGIARAFVANQTAGEISQGASTLTMQYVRMALRDGAMSV